MRFVIYLGHQKRIFEICLGQLPLDKHFKLWNHYPSKLSFHLAQGWLGLYIYWCKITHFNSTMKHRNIYSLICRFMYVCMCVCMYVCMYVCMHESMYIHTYSANIYFLHLMHMQPGHNTQPHARLPPGFLGMDAYMTSRMRVHLIRILLMPLMCLF